RIVILDPVGTRFHRQADALIEMPDRPQTRRYPLHPFFIAGVVGELVDEHRTQRERVAEVGREIFRHAQAPGIRMIGTNEGLAVERESLEARIERLRRPGAELYRRLVHSVFAEDARAG